MAITVKHAKTSTIPDGADTDLVRPSDWNADHTLTGLGTMAEQNANSVSITGGTVSGVTLSNDTISGGIGSPDYIAFNTSYATALTAGQLGWDGNNTLGLGMAGGNVTQHIGEDQFFYYKASSSVTKGQVVMFTGAVGASGVPTGAPATGITDGTYIMGVAAESVATNGFGLVQSFGTLRNVDTSAYSDGDILWYNPSVTGGLTATKPSAPNVKVQMAAVVNGGSSGGGTILIRINLGSTLGGTDSNAQITSPTGGQTLTYDQTDGYWKNTSLTAGTAITITPDSNGAISISSSAVTSVTGTSPISSSGGTTPTISLGTVPAANGGTGLTSPGTSGNVLTSNGTAWVSSAPSSGITWSSVQTGNFTATAGNGYPINTTSSAITVTLPASPTAGQQIILTDYAGTWATNNVTINPNGNKVIGQTVNGILSTNNSTCSLVYVDSTKGWISYSNVVPSYVYTVEYLVVAGGGGGGYDVGGGGGAGGYRSSVSGESSGGGSSAESAISISAGTSYTVTVGAGGAGGAASNAGIGSNSVFGSITSSGGGRGSGTAAYPNSSGGCGGGGGRGTSTGGAGTSNQGYEGGNQGATLSSGGGGGAGAAGSTGGGTDTSRGGAGGVGVQSSINGSATYRAGGGGGGDTGNNLGGAGGNGGGGAGGSGTSGGAGIVYPSNGTTNTGGGGGGGRGYDGYGSTNGASGGSGVVIIRYSGSQRGTGGTVTSSGGYTIHTFTSSGTYTA